MISEKINNILNEQINKEFYSGYLYLSMSANMKELGLNGFASWLKHQAKEEVGHGLKIFDYLIDRNSFVTLKQINTPDFEFNGIISVFNIIYEHEKCITNAVMTVAKLAEEECDRTTLNFIDWFIEEQQKELPADRGFFDIDMAAFKSVLEINTLGTVIPSRIFGLQMAKAGGGAILNFASMNTYRPLTRVAPYAMSKAAIANWTMFFAQYMAPAKVRVNAVAPGFMVNERSKQYLMTPDGGLSPRGEQVMHHTPAGRFGEAEDLLGCVNWLLDDSVSSFVTGITVPVDGGFLSSAGV